jgi:carboxypeptidase Taq
MTNGQRYDAFLSLIREIFDIERAEELLSWDQQTYMPPKGADARASQLATLAGIRHELQIGDRMAGLLAALDESDRGGLDADARVNVREVRRIHERERKVPTELVRELARLQSLSQEAWVAARKASDFASFAPWLEKILAVRIRIADAIGYGESRYDAMLDEFEPGATAAEIAQVFDRLKERLVPFVRRTLEASGRSPEKPVTGSYPVLIQEKLARRLAEMIGFDLGAGRIDVSAHPFTMGNLHDVRFTNRYDESDLRVGIFGALHETGHALYEQGYDPAHAGTPRASYASLGVHESQSRMWENFVGRSRAFWEHALPVVVEHFPEASSVTLDRWYRNVNRVEASLIRVEADEVTYNLHILLRFELEKELAEGRLAVRDLPEAWNGRMRAYLGLTPPKDAVGVLQDIHWSLGLLGYFPTYALGNLYAAQLYRAAARAVPGLEEGFREGRFAPLLEWLRTAVHRRGRTYRAGELVRAVTGEPLNPSYLMEYLEAKYGALYPV